MLSVRKLELVFKILTSAFDKSIELRDVLSVPIIVYKFPKDGLKYISFPLGLT